MKKVTINIEISKTDEGTALFNAKNNLNEEYAQANLHVITKSAFQQLLAGYIDDTYNDILEATGLEEFNEIPH